MGLKRGESRWEREKIEREEKRNNKKEEREISELKNNIRTYHSVIVPSYIYDGTLAL